jgi:hypothetical protein
MGFIFNLKNLRASTVRSKGLKWDSFPSNIGTGDSTLMRFLRRANLKDEQNAEPVIESLVLKYIKSSDHSEVKHLLSIISESPAESVPLFSKETVAGFHSLVTGAFVGFASAFLQIRKLYEKLVSMDYQALEM